MTRPPTYPKAWQYGHCPHASLEDALETLVTDASHLQENTLYHPDNHAWHGPTPNLGAKREDQACFISIPGAYIAGTLDADCRDIVTPANYPAPLRHFLETLARLPTDTEAALFALNIHLPLRLPARRTDSRHLLAAAAAYAHPLLSATRHYDLWKTYRAHITAHRLILRALRPAAIIPPHATRNQPA